MPQDEFVAIATTSPTSTAATIGNPFNGTISKSGRVGAPASVGAVLSASWLIRTPWLGRRQT
jgi:hypothetical protein